MKLTEAQFKLLQREWDKKLEDSGFRDVERIRASEPKPLHPMIRYTREAYYRILAEIVSNEATVFKCDMHRFILEQYAEGKTITVIVESIKQKGWSRQRKSIRTIIRKYEMAWNIRSYTRKQLNLKDDR